MQNELSNDTSVSNEKVVLELFGINKKWIHSSKNGWVEINKKPTTSNVTINEVEDEVENEGSSKKWWAFRKK
jgi:hypothetical protein